MTLPKLPLFVFTRNGEINRVVKREDRMSDITQLEDFDKVLESFDTTDALIKGKPHYLFSNGKRELITECIDLNLITFKALYLRFANWVFNFLYVTR